MNVLAHFEAYPRSSTRAISSELEISRSSVQRIMSKNNYHPFKFSRIQKLHPGDHLRRIEFCENFLLHIQEDENFLSKIIWCDESKFSQEGIFNMRNQHFWSTENPHATRVTESQFQFRINVFCLMMNDRVKFFLYEENLNAAGFLRILNEVVVNFLDELPLSMTFNRYFQMDGAPAHGSRMIDEKLTNLFEDRWWGNTGPFLWPPRSPDLTPLDFYLWGRVKELVYSSRVENLEQLRRRIVEAFSNLDPLEIRRATQSVRNRALKCLEQNGGHFEHLL